MPSQQMADARSQGGSGRTRSITAILAALVLVLTACGGGGSDDTTGSPSAIDTGEATTSAPSETTLAAGADAADTKVVDTDMGPVEIPADPQRIISLDNRATLQPLDDLGAPLVGAQTRTDGQWEALSEATQQLASIGVRGDDLDLEAIVELQPDVIVGDGETEIYDQLTAIAPTLIISREDDWTEHMLVLADIVNESELAQELIAGVEERMVELEAAIAERWPEGVQVTLLRVRDDLRITQAEGRGDVGPWLLREVDGISVTGDLRNVEDDGISPEQLREADGDVILYFGGGGGSDANQEEEFLLNLIDNPLWEGLSAVQADRAHSVDSDLWFSGSGVTAAHLAIDDLFTYVAEAP